MRGGSRVHPITASDDEIRAFVAEAEVPPLLPALAYVTGDLSLLRDDLRPDPTLMALPQGGLSAAQLATLNIDRSGMNRTGMDIQTHIRHRYGHGRTLPPLHGVSRSQSPARQTPDLVTTEGPAFNPPTATQPP